MRNTKEFLEELPEPYRSEALNNCRSTYNSITYNQSVQKMNDWSATPSGYSFWIRVYIILENHECDCYNSLQYNSL